MCLRKQIIIICLMGIFLLICIFCFRNKDSKKPSSPLETVSTVIAKKIASIDELESMGTAISNEAVDIISPISQVVQSIHFSDGESVTKGQLLVQLKIDKKISEKKQTEIALLEQKRELDRMEILKKNKIIPIKDYDVQLTKFHDAQAKLDTILTDIAESSINAPFDGFLGIRNISVGSLLTPGTVITTIDDIKKIKIDFFIPEKYLSIVTPGLKFHADSVAFKNKTFKGNIAAIAPRLSVNSRSIHVRGIIDNDELLLKPGMMLKVKMQLPGQYNILIPEKAISNIGSEHFIFVVSSKRQVKQIFISIGERKNGFVEALKGLEEGDVVVIDGINKITNGQHVNIENTNISMEQHKA